MDKYKILAVMVVLLACVPLTQSQAASCTLDIGSPAPGLSGTDISGTIQSLEDHIGEWVYVDFWATWCKPCMRELPGVVELNRQLGNRDDFAVISVSLDDSKTLDSLHDVVNRHGVGYPVVYEGKNFKSDLARDWCVNAIPATFLIDPAGRVVARDIHPSQVERYLTKSEKKRVAEPTYKPMQVSSFETLRADSPTTGRSNIKDLEINLDIQNSASQVNSYQLNLVASIPNTSGPGYQELSMRYDVDVIVNKQTSSFPYYVDIRNTTGAILTDALNPIDINNTPSKAATLNIPHMSVSVDLQQNKYVFIVPLPANCKDVRYSVAMYDDQLGEYVRNGLRYVQNAPNY